MIKCREHVLPALLALIVFVPLTWWTLDRRPPFTVLEVDTIPDPLVSGETFYYRNKVQFFGRQCWGTLHRAIVDRDGQIWQQVPIETLLGQDTGPPRIEVMTGRPFIVPRAIPPGHCTIRATHRLHCNPVHYFFPLVYVSPSVDCEIVAR